MLKEKSRQEYLNKRELQKLGILSKTLEAEQMFSDYPLSETELLRNATNQRLLDYAMQRREMNVKPKAYLMPDCTVDAPWLCTDSS